jgi:hypothetical protein
MSEWKVTVAKCCPLSVPPKASVAHLKTTSQPSEFPRGLNGADGIKFIKNETSLVTNEGKIWTLRKRNLHSSKVVEK